jgi:hypothetical protein
MVVGRQFWIQVPMDAGSLVSATLYEVFRGTEARKRGAGRSAAVYERIAVVRECPDAAQAEAWAMQLLAKNLERTREAGSERQIRVSAQPPSAGRP